MALISASAVAYINANDPVSYTPGAEVMNDITGSAVIFESSPGVTTFLNDGGMDFSARNNFWRPSTSLSLQTISLWYKKTSLNEANPIDLRSDVTAFIAQHHPTQTAYGDFFINAAVYIDGILSDHDTVDAIPIGELHNIVYVAQAAVSSQFTLLANFADLFSFGCIFHSALFYDSSLTAAEVLYNYQVLLSNPVANFTSPFTATMYTHLADITWPAVTGATTYTITQTENAGDPVIIADSIPDLAITSYNLNPGSSYEYNLYTELDLVTPEDTVTESTLAVDTTSVTDLMVRLDNDLTLMDESSIGDIELELRNVLSTGEIVALNTGNAVFVQQSDTIQVVTSKNVLTPFESSLTSGSITVTTEEGDSSVITYDESLNQVTFDGSTVLDVGNYTIIGKYKVRVAEI